MAGKELRQGTPCKVAREQQTLKIHKSPTWVHHPVRTALERPYLVPGEKNMHSPLPGIPA